MKKARIPAALREQVWISCFGDRMFKHKCSVKWCQNQITPFDFEAGHNVPESKGGVTDLTNLVPICARCNRSMGNTFTIEQFSDMSKRSENLWESYRRH